MITNELKTKIKELASLYPEKESAILPAIYLVQADNNGVASSIDLTELADLMDISQARIFGVQTYYTMYNREPVGKYHLQIDTNIPAMLAGAKEILEHLKSSLGIEVGDTTADGLFTLSEVEDLASCGTCPVIQVNDRYFENLTIAKTDELIESLRRGIMPDWEPEQNFGTVCNVLFKRRGIENSHLIDVYLANDGYKALEKSFAMEPSAIKEEVKKSELRGLGGAGFKAGVKWGFLPKDTDKPIYLLCNADEGEPGTFKDRQIMEYDPHMLIEGMIISGFAIGAKLGIIYIRGEFAWIAGILEKAIDEAREKGYLGDNILGKGFDFDIIVHLGAGSYICGEETAMIDSIEGKRGNPRVKPPFPAVEGLYGCPTIVNNVETLACVPYIVKNGADAFKQFGHANNYGPKLFNVSGHVNKPGVYEFPMGTPLKTILETAGGIKGNMKAVIVGGLSTPLLTADEADGLNMDFDSCVAKGTMFGTGGIIVMNDTVNIPEIAMRTIKFYAHESCGQCVPCREGSKVIKNLLSKIIAGEGTAGDLVIVEDLCKSIPGTTLCAMGDAFAVPVGAMISKFRSEFEALL